MELLLQCLLFAVGIVLVVKGGDLFVDAASWIAHAMHIPTFIIGATIVSLATTMPEMLVSSLAAADGKPDMAVGNAVGSVTANIGLIMAVAMLAMNIVCQRKQYMKQCLLLIAASAVLCVSCLGGTLNVIGSIVLFVLFVTFMTINVVSAKADMSADTDKEAVAVDKKQVALKILLFIVSAVAIVIGSRLMVDSGSAIATAIGIPERIIALTLVAVGTSLPELVTTVTAIVKKESALSVGNIIGANIIDLSLILPICSLVSGKELPVTAQSAAVDIPVCLGFVLVAMLPMMIREKAYKWQGGIMLAAYIAYVVIISL